MRQLASYSDAIEDIKTKALRTLIESDDRIVGFSIEKEEGRVYIHTDSSKWCDGAGGGTFSGSSESAAVRCFKAEVQAAEPASGFEAAPDFRPAGDGDERLVDAMVAQVVTGQVHLSRKAREMLAERGIDPSQAVVEDAGVSPRVALNALNTLVENTNPDHTGWATINGRMVICHRIEIPGPKPLLQWWVDGAPISGRDLAKVFGIDTASY